MALTPAERLELIERISGVGEEVADLAYRVDAITRALAAADAQGPQVGPCALPTAVRPEGLPQDAP